MYSAIRDIVEVSSNIPKVYLYFDYLFSFIIDELNQHRSSAVFSYFFSFSFINSGKDTTIIGYLLIK